MNEIAETGIKELETSAVSRSFDAFIYHYRQSTRLKMRFGYSPLNKWDKISSGCKNECID